MKLSQDTILKLATQGIEVKWYPTTYEEHLKKCWEKEYKWAYDYEHCLVTQEDWTEEQLVESATKWANGRAQRTANDKYNADILYIEYGKERKMICQKISVKSKEITEDYILKRIAKEEKAYAGYYGQFTLKMKRILKENKIDGGMNVYPTTYGIGVWVFYNWNADAQSASVAKVLDKYGVDYTNEYSDHRWVYRFKVSKRAENLAKLN